MAAKEKGNASRPPACQRAALFLVWEIEVFEGDESFRGVYLLLELRSEFALLLDGFEDGFAALVEAAEIAKAFVKLAKYFIV